MVGDDRQLRGVLVLFMTRSSSNLVSNASPSSATMEHSDKERSPSIGEKDTPSQPQWKPGRAEWLVFLCMAILSLIVSLDTTAVAPVLPVSR